MHLRAIVTDACREKPGLEAQLCDILHWPNLHRLLAYERGKHFVSPDSLRRIAIVIGGDWLTLLVDAGYLREVLEPLHALSLYDDREELDSWRVQGLPIEGLPSSREIAVRFAVERFPLRTERFQSRNAYGDLLFNSVFAYQTDSAMTARDGRSRLPKHLRMAHEALVDGDLERDTKLSVAAEYVRAWARSVDGKLTRTLESDAAKVLPLSVSRSCAA